MSTRKIAIAVVAAVVAVIGLYSFLEADTDTADTVASVETAVDEPGAPGLASPARVVPSVRGVPRRALPKDAKPYELSGQTPTFVAVSLDGGQSGVYSAGRGPAVDDVRTVRGRVLMAGSRGPVVGAVVLAGKKLDGFFAGSITAERGVVTDAQGKFELGLPADESYRVVAMHRQIGWSGVTTVTAGRGDHQLELIIDSPGEVAGRVTQGDEPIEALVELRSTSDTLSLKAKCDADGRYTFRTVAAGDYRLRAVLKMGMTGGLSRAATESIQVTPGESMIQDLHLPSGTILAIIVEFPDGDVAMTDYALLEGKVKIDTQKQLAAYAATLDKRPRGLLYGGVDAKNIMHFYDLDANDYTVCVTVKMRGAEKPREFFACQHAAVGKDDDVVESKVSF